MRALVLLLLLCGGGGGAPWGALASEDLPPSVPPAPPRSPSPFPPPFPPPGPSDPPFSDGIVHSTKRYDDTLRLGTILLIVLAVVLFGLLLPLVACFCWGAGAAIEKGDCADIPVTRHDALLKGWNVDHGRGGHRDNYVAKVVRDCEDRNGRVVVAPPRPYVHARDSANRSVRV